MTKSTPQDFVDAVNHTAKVYAQNMQLLAISLDGVAKVFAQQLKGFSKEVQQNLKNRKNSNA